MSAASLPMYNFAGMRAANGAFWSALSELLREDGVEDVPESLSAERPPVPDAIEPDVLFSQTCGYPLQTIYAGQHRILATPGYEAPGCEGMTHCAFIVVPEDHAAATLEDLRGERFALNSLHSNSGMNLPRRLIAPLAREGRFFGSVIHSGGHAASLRLLREGKADAASIDNLTWAFAQDYAPEQIAGLRILARTPGSPSIPFVTSIVTPPETVAALRRALLALGREPHYAAVRRALRMSTIDIIPRDYGELLSYVREAAEFGYPEIA